MSLQGTARDFALWEAEIDGVPPRTWRDEGWALPRSRPHPSHQQGETGGWVLSVVLVVPVWTLLIWYLAA